MHSLCTLSLQTIQTLRSSALCQVRTGGFKSTEKIRVVARSQFTAEDVAVSYGHHVVSEGTPLTPSQLVRPVRVTCMMSICTHVMIPRTDEDGR